MPKTAGKRTPVKMYDPARVSHIPVRQSVRHPFGVAGSLATPDPRVVGATPLDPGLKSGHPYRVAFWVWLIHRSVALRASTDAYGAGILSDAGVLCEPISLGRASDASDSSDPSDKIAQSAALHPARVLGV